mmetsp:Transcript_10054/g.25032  ORF Transcript_10054/g.25032 Transcript_10054/m.25032 type:complete len:256 (-) Transcript_10054:534-1301(-)
MISTAWRPKPRSPRVSWSPEAPCRLRATCSAARSTPALESGLLRCTCPRSGRICRRWRAAALSWCWAASTARTWCRAQRGRSTQSQRFGPPTFRRCRPAASASLPRAWTATSTWRAGTPAPQTARTTTTPSASRPLTGTMWRARRGARSRILRKRVATWRWRRQQASSTPSAAMALLGTPSTRPRSSTRLRARGRPRPSCPTPARAISPRLRSLGRSTYPVGGTRSSRMSWWPTTRQATAGPRSRPCRLRAATRP